MSYGQIADTFRALTPADLRILLGTELGMASREYVPVSRIVRYANLLEEEVLKRLPGLVDKRVVASGAAGALGYAGYRLTFLGYDCLALNALVRRDAVLALGGALGLGKESDVYSAKGRRGVRIALKFHRLGRVSFRQTRRTREYVADRSHTSWIYQARMAATREFASLKRAKRVRVPVPKPIAQNRHIVAMSMVEGSGLSNVPYLPHPHAALRSILISLRRLYTGARLVHGDMSAYNILVTASGRFTLIDWPQSVERSDPRAEELLKRDVSNTLSFFAKEYGTHVSPQDALDFVRGKRKTLKLSSQAAA
jgi:RIO kinase 2